MKASFDYVPEMANSELYLDFKITKGKKSQTIPSVKIADGVVETSELPTAASSNASYANDAFQRIIKAVSYTHLLQWLLRTLPGRRVGRGGHVAPI